MARSKQLFPLLLIMATGALAAKPGNEIPETPAERTVERIHGRYLADPYRWLENWDDPRIPNWVEQQNQFTHTQVAGALYDDLAGHFTELLGPQDKALEIPHQKIQHLRLRERFLPVQAEATFRTTKNSPTGRYEIVQRSHTSSDFKLLQIKDHHSDGRLLEDFLLVKFAGNVIWANDESGFYYYTDRDGRMGSLQGGFYFHQLGQIQGEDQLVLQQPTFDTDMELSKVGDQFYLTLGREGMYSLYHLDDLENGNREKLAGPLLGLQTVGSLGDELLIKTLEGAPMGRVIAVNLTTKASREVVPSREHYLDQVLQHGDQFFLTYIEDSEHRLYRYRQGEESFGEIPLPGSGSASVYENDGKLLVAFSSYDSPQGVWRFEPTRDLLVVETPAAAPPFPVNKVKTFYTAHNGRQIPIWLVKHADTVLDENAPVYLYGYGGFSINIMPSFWTTSQPFLKRGGVVAIVTLPGGLEYGEEWHRAGNRHNKRNVFDDFASAGLALFAQGISRPEKMAIGGGSNGGLLVGATMNLYPDLFRAAVPEVGVMDMTRFSLFTAGKWWADEYGYREDLRDFTNLLALSPYHNLRPAVRYPATLVMTADLDDRVVPSHSWKYAARLQSVSRHHPALLHTKVGGSHSSYSGTLAKKVKYHSTKWAFIMQELGMKP